MADRLYVASRKGLLTFAPASGGWALQASAFVGDPVTAVLPDPRDGTLYAGLNLGHFGVKLHRSRDRGETWEELPAPAFPADAQPEKADAKTGPAVGMLWCLAAGGADQPGVLWAGTIPGALFRSGDRGETWSLVEALWTQPGRQEWAGGGYDSAGIHSICVDPRNSGRLAVAVSSAGVWRSGDAGATWRLGGRGLRAAYMPPDLAMDPAVQDPHRVVQCPVAPDVLWCQHHNGIFRSDDGGATFSEIEAAAPSRFGFAVVVHPRDPDAAWFVPAVKDECRVPVDRRLVVMRTDDGGASFATFSDGLPPPPAFDLVYRHGLDIDDTGKNLAMGTTTGNLWVGDDGGRRWTALSRHLPPINQVAWGP